MNVDLKSIVLDDVNIVDFSYFVENIRKMFFVNNSTCLKLSYISSILKPPRTKYILDNIEVKCNLLGHFLVSQSRSVLYIELVEKNEYYADKRNEGYERDIEEVLRGDYFDVDIDALRVYDVAFVQGRKGDIIDEPTSEQTLR